MKKIRTNFLTSLLVVLLSISLFSTKAFSQDNNSASSANILVLLSYHASHSWTVDILDGIKEQFAISGKTIDFHIEFMDTKRNHPEIMFPQLEQLYRTKYKNNHFDLIILADNNALNFLLPRRTALFPKVPIVFCGINNFTPDLIKDFDNITGIEESSDFSGTIELALKLQPKTKHIAVVCDHTETGIAHIKETQKIYPNFEKDIKFIELFNQSEDELKDSLRKLPPNSIVFLLSFYRDRNDKHFPIQEQAEFITTAASIPVYTAWDISLGFGVLGGVMTNGRSQGENAAQLAIRILDGESPEQIPVVSKSPNVPTLDYAVAKHFNIPITELPAKTIFINKPVSFYHNNKQIIWTTFLVVLAQSLVIFFLILNVRKRRIAERLLSEHGKRLKSIVEERTIELSSANKELLQEVDARKKALQQEKNLTQIIEKSLNEIFLFDIDTYQFLFVNKGAISDTGYSLSELLKMTPVDIKPEIDQPLFEHMLSPVKTGKKKKIVFETLHRRKNGSTYPVEVHVEKIKYHSKPVFVATIIDISERKKMSQNYQDLIEGTNDLIVQMDSKGKILFTNDVSKIIFGIPPEELPGQNGFQFVHPEDLERTKNWFKNCLKEHIIRDSIEHRIINEITGIVYDLQWSSTFQFDDSGHLIANIGIGHDITELKQLEAKLRQSQKMEAIGNMAGGIAHDFNNILSAIIGYAEFIKDDAPPNSNLEKNINEVLAAGMRATSLVKQILAFSHQEIIEKQVLSPHLIVKEALDMLHATLPTTVTIKQDINTDCGRIVADPTILHQIVLNLCTNGLQAMQDQKGILQVGLQPRKLTNTDIKDLPGTGQKSFVVLTVQDNGCGMDKSIFESIFDPYFTTKEKGKGTGLGLAIIHSAVEEYGGFIKVESKPAEGTLFSIYFPVTEEPATQLNYPDQEEPVKLLPEDKKIMIVDDDMLLVKINETRLTNIGYQVTAVTDSKKALEIFQNDPDSFSLLITDQTMPGLTGADLVGEILKITPSLPIIMCTGHSDVVSEADAAAIGIKKYVFKPLYKDELLEAIKEVLAES